VFHVVSEFM